MSRSAKEKNIEVEKFVDYLASSDDLKFSKPAMRRFKKEYDIKHIVEGFETPDPNTSKLPPSRRGISLSAKDKKIAERLGLSNKTMVEEIIKEKYEIFKANKEIMRKTINPMLSDFKKFSSTKLEKKLEYKYASTSKKRQITLKEGLKKTKYNKNSKVGRKIIRDNFVSYEDYDYKLVQFVYDAEATQNLYNALEQAYRMTHNDKPPSPPIQVDSIYKVYYGAEETKVKVVISDTKGKKDLNIL